MCGRFTLLISWRGIHGLLAGFVDELKENSPPVIAHAPPRFNIAPTQPILILRSANGTVEAKLVRWGLVPEWVEDPADFPLIINARGETLLDKTSFKNAVKNRRCIIPASGYYEWKKNDDGSKTPIYVKRKDGLPVLMAGLYSTWVGPDGEEVDTAAIITVAANADLSPVHHRTPAVLEHNSIAEWLDCAHVNGEGAMKLLRTFSPGATTYHPVSTRVNSPKNDDENLINPVFEQNETAPVKPIKPAQLNLF